VSFRLVSSLVDASSTPAEVPVTSTTSFAPPGSSVMRTGEVRLAKTSTCLIEVDLKPPASALME